MKQQVKEYSNFDVIYCFDCSFGEIIEVIEEYKSCGWEGLELCYYGYDGGKELLLYKFREETDEEYQKRLKEEEEIKIDSEKQKEKRRKQYEHLKKEFGE